MSDKITYQYIIDAVAELEAHRVDRPYLIQANQDTLRLMRAIFTEYEIAQIFMGAGPGWVKYLELVKDE